MSKFPKHVFRSLRLVKGLASDYRPDGIGNVVNKRGCLGGCSVRIDVSHDYGDERDGIKERIVEAVNIMAAIDELRDDENARVTILADSVDFGDKHESAVLVVGDWTDWSEATYDGRTLLDALTKAVEVKRKVDGRVRES